MVSLYIKFVRIVHWAAQWFQYIVSSSRTDKFVTVRFILYLQTNLVYHFSCSNSSNVCLSSWFLVEFIIMTAYKCYRSAFTPPEVWCAKTADELKEFTIANNILSHEVFSAASGPDTGVKFVTSLCKEEDSLNNNRQCKIICCFYLVCFC